MRPSEIGRNTAMLAFALGVLNAPGCSERMECGAGTALVGGRCEAVCASGTEQDPESGRCVAICMAGTHRDTETGGCLPESARCVSGQVWDPEIGACLEVASLCADGTTWVASAQRCVDDAALRTAAYTEHPRENDPTWGGPGAYEAFNLAPEGDPITLTGRVDAPRDRNGDGIVEPDFDLWVFRADAPMLLRIAADGLGGSTSGFQIVALGGPFWTRFGIGTTSTDVERDVFLPHAGYYAIVAADALSFVVQGAGPYHGGGDFGYFISVTRRPMPAPTPLVFEGESAVGTGTLPVEAPVDGSMPSFYTVEVEPHAVYDFGVTSLAQHGPLAAELVVLPEKEPPFWSPGKMTKGFLEGQQVLLVVDDGYYFGTEAATHEVRVDRRESRWLDGPLPTSSYHQNGFSAASAEVEAARFAFEATEGDVVTAHVTSSTGTSCVEVWDEYFGALLGNLACVPGPSVPPLYEGDLRFVAPESAFFGMTVADWQGAEYWSDGFIRTVPEHDFELGLEMRYQTPASFGALSGGRSGSDTLTSDAPERFATIRPGTRQALRGTVSGALSPVTTVYEGGAGNLRPATVPTDGVFVWRAVDEEPLLFGVRDAEGAAASYDVVLTPLDIGDLGTVPESGPFEVLRSLARGHDRWFFHLSGAKAGDVSLQVTPPAGVDVTVAALDGNLSRYDAAPRDDAGPGGPEELVAPIADDGLFFEVRTASGAPLDLDTEIAIAAALVPAAAEGSQNDHYIWSQRLGLPAAVAAEIEAPGDVDWYRVEVEEETILTITTLPRGTTPVADTWILLANATGGALATNDDGGVGRHARLERLFLVPGLYTIAVGADSEGTGGYLFSVTERAP